MINIKELKLMPITNLNFNITNTTQELIELFYDSPPLILNDLPIKEKDKYIGVGYVISNGTFTVKDGFICGECIFSENNNYEYLDCQVDISDIDGKIVKIIAIQVKECK